MINFSSIAIDEFVFIENYFKENQIIDLFITEYWLNRVFNNQEVL